VLALIEQMEALARDLPSGKNVHLSSIADRFSSAVSRLKEATLWIVETFPQPAAVAAGSVYYLKLMGITCGGWMLARSAQIAAKQLEAGEGDAAFLRAKLLTARFYGDHILARHRALFRHDARRRQRACSRGRAALTAWLMVLATALAVAMDAVAVSITSGMARGRATWGESFRMGAVFGLFQARCPPSATRSAPASGRDRGLRPLGGVRAARRRGACT
jgi:hypothetical protein